jgi:FlaA1/EpsC-like NDP-sugar epimerase
MAAFYALGAATGDPAASAFPKSFWPIEALLSLAFLGGARFAIRAASEHARTRSGGSGTGSAALLYGAGEAGALLARSARRHPEAGVRPVGFLDDDERMAGGYVAGLKVYGGLEAMERAVAATGAQKLLISMPSAPGTAVRPILEAALALKLDVRTVPAFEDLLDGSVDAFRVRQVRVEDLLRRPIVTDHARGVDALIHGRTVLITGAGGSIGSELARQVFAIGPKRLILVDRAESALYLLERELESRGRKGHGSGEVVVHLANVASRVEMERFVARELPTIIFHAAAFKHVPLMESHPSDAAHVNIGGTMVMLDAAIAAGVERFVFVSTDKAVRPTSVMGASKRVAEMLVADAARRSGRPYVSVRFGNVLGSNGSVVPIFRDQLENGEPLTVTHPEMTRYFMTIPEAAWLILDAAALGTNGDLFVLDMGEPVRIMDLARDLVRLAGRDPDSQPIEIVGLRPGEKLHEELFYEAEEVEPTSSPKVLKALTASPPDDIRVNARRIIEMATGADEARVGAAILHLARGGDVAVEGVSVAIPPHPRPTVTRRDTTVQAGDRREPPHEVVASVPGS